MESGVSGGRRKEGPAGARGTETAFKSEPLADFEIIHIAAHGIASAKFSDRAALVLGNGPKSGEDGLLQVREIRDPHLAADLGTLSACDTGVGALEGEEGIANLVSAFVFAGAKSVVASLWAASDPYTITLTRGIRPQPKTGVLFPDRRFKTGIVTSSPVNQQSSIINRQSNGHAILLGGFIMVGDGSRNIRLSLNGRR